MCNVRHSCEDSRRRLPSEAPVVIPAEALVVIPAEAGIQGVYTLSIINLIGIWLWIPASAGMTTRASAGMTTGTTIQD